MSVLHAPVAALAWLGRQGTRAIAALVFIGIAVPPLGALLKPYVTESIFLLLCIAFLRLEPAALRGCLGRRALVLAATAWTTLAIPILLGAAGLLLGQDALSPDLVLALMLQAVGGALPDVAWLYFALSQFPIYLSPQLLKAVVRRRSVRKRRMSRVP